MGDPRASITDWDIYVIGDRRLAGGMSHLDIARLVFEAGGRVYQLRDKDATDDELAEDAATIAREARAQGTVLLIDDRVELAARCGAHGVHLGQGDVTPNKARKILGDDAIIGFSTHNAAQLEAALPLIADPATHIDYLAYGPLFPTRNKTTPEPVADLAALKKLRPRIRVPIVGIGGINADNMALVIAAEIDIVAVIGAVMAPSAMELVRNLRELRKTYLAFQSGRVTT